MFLCLIASLVSFISHFLGHSVPEYYCLEIFLLFYDPSHIDSQGSFLLNLTSFVFIRFLALPLLNSLILDVNAVIFLFSLKYFLPSFYSFSFLGWHSWLTYPDLSFHFWQWRPTFNCYTLFWSFIRCLSLAIIITCSESYLDLFLFEIWGICMSLISSDGPLRFPLHYLRVSNLFLTLIFYSSCISFWSNLDGTYNIINLTCKSDTNHPWFLPQAAFDGALADWIVFLHWFDSDYFDIHPEIVFMWLKGGFKNKQRNIYLLPALQHPMIKKFP